MKITLEVPDKVAREMNARRDELPAIIQFGLDQWRGYPTPTHRELSVSLRRLAGADRPEKILALRPTPKLSRRIRELLEKNRGAGLTANENAEMDAVMRVEHLVQLAKATAATQLREARRK